MAPAAPGQVHGFLRALSSVSSQAVPIFWAVSVRISGTSNSALSALLDLAATAEGSPTNSQLLETILAHTAGRFAEFGYDGAPWATTRREASRRTDPARRYRIQNCERDGMHGAAVDIRRSGIVGHSISGGTSPITSVRSENCCLQGRRLCSLRFAPVQSRKRACDISNASIVRAGGRTHRGRQHGQPRPGGQQRGCWRAHAAQAGWRGRSRGAASCLPLEWSAVRMDRGGSSSG